MKPFSQACENNKNPILAELKRLLEGRHQVLEIGSGTGQHATFFAPFLPHLTWYTSDVEQNHAGIRAWIDEFPAKNLQPPKVYRVGRDPWPVADVDTVFSANTVHIMAPEAAEQMFHEIGANLSENGLFCLYGPFSYSGQHTSASNHSFDQSLRAQSYGGIRDLDELSTWGSDAGLELREDNSLPANNRLLVWRRASKT